MKVSGDVKLKEIFMSKLQELEQKDRRFCVYMYQKQDDGDIYYIGQGTIARSKAMNKHSKICQSIDKIHGTNILIYKDNLTKQEALDLEVKLIKQYVEEYGYGLSISGYYKKGGKNLANGTFGGEHSMIGELNPAKRKDVREKLSKHAREHNSFALEEVRKKDSERMKEFSNTKEHKELQSQRMKDFYQTEEGQIQKQKQSKISKEYWREHREEHIQKIKDYYKTEKGKEQIRKNAERHRGMDAPNAEKIICVETQQTYKSMKQLSLLLHKNEHYITWHFHNRLREDGTIEITVDGRILHYKKI